MIRYVYAHLMSFLENIFRSVANLKKACLAVSAIRLTIRIHSVI